MDKELSKLYVAKNPEETILHVRFKLDEIQTVEDILIEEDVAPYVSDIFRMLDEEDKDRMAYMITFTEPFGIFVFAHWLGIDYIEKEKEDKTLPIDFLKSYLTEEAWEQMQESYTEWREKE